MGGILREDAWYTIVEMYRIAEALLDAERKTRIKHALEALKPFSVYEEEQRGKPSLLYDGRLVKFKNNLESDAQAMRERKVPAHQSMMMI